MPKTRAFKRLLAATKREYLGKDVPARYRKKYGLTYDSIALKKGIKTDKVN